jgi:hypothetical protein
MAAPIIQLTLDSLIFKFIEPYITAWKALPLSVRQLMVDSPHLFSLQESISKINAPYLIFNGVVLRQSKNDNNVPDWVLEAIVVEDMPVITHIKSELSDNFVVSAER